MNAANGLSASSAATAASCKPMPRVTRPLSSITAVVHCWFLPKAFVAGSTSS